MKILINEGEHVEIAGEVFPTGEWKHRPIKWCADNAVALAAHPEIKEAYVVLEERTKKAMSDYGLDSFAEGLKEAAALYKQPIPEIANDVSKLSIVKDDQVK